MRRGRSCAATDAPLAPVFITRYRDSVATDGGMAGRRRARDRGLQLALNLASLRHISWVVRVLDATREAHKAMRQSPSEPRGSVEGHLPDARTPIS